MRYQRICMIVISVPMRKDVLGTLESENTVLCNAGIQDKIVKLSYGNSSDFVFFHVQLEQCVVNEWSSWSNPFAFGVIERRRTVVQKGVCCPDDLVQQVNVSAYIGELCAMCLSFEITEVILLSMM